MTEGKKMIEETKELPTRRLNSIQNVRQMVASVIARFEVGGPVTDPERARVLIQGGVALSSIMRDVETNERFAKLEKEIEQLKSSIIRRVG